MVKNNSNVHNPILKKWIEDHGGSRIIERVLICNNGIAAVKAIRSIRKWCYETFHNHSMIQFIVMATPEDQSMNAEYIRMADELAPVPGGANNNNYANVELIVDIAERHKVDAVWAGWGHASENPKLPASLAAAGIVFMGPSAAPMQALGDKISATLLAQSADVSVIPWSGQGLKVEYDPKKGVTGDAFRKATVRTYEEAKTCMENIGLPLMIKASEGGGGKGIRKVTKAEDLEAAFRNVQVEVPGSPIFLMRLANNCRHLEVQILADTHGQAIAVHGRDCSIQRRHQKVIEEGPVIAAPPEIWVEMEKAAVRMTKSVQYEGVGTVEYLYIPSEKKYAFLELNPRLQVEHPVSEWISHVNLPASQLQVAMGIPLHRMPQIRTMYDQSAEGDSVIDFDNVRPVPPSGHVIACRVTAENPDAGFRPTSGSIKEVTFRSLPGVWGYFSVTQGTLSEFSDSQFGHLFAHGPTREAARKLMITALKDTTVAGEIQTPLEYLIRILETSDFQDGQFDTSWLDARITGLAQLTPDKVTAVHRAPLSSEELIKKVAIAAAYRGSTILTAAQHAYTESLNRGQAPSLRALRTHLPIELIYEDTKYNFSIDATGPNHFVLSMNGGAVEVETKPLGDDGLIVLMDGRLNHCRARIDANTLRLTVGNRTSSYGLKEDDPTKITAASSGKIIRYLVDDGGHVNAGENFVEIEVMKMLMTLVTNESGVIHFEKSPGSRLETGDVIASIDLDDPSKVKRVSICRDELPRMKPPTATGSKPNQILRQATAGIHAVLEGYAFSPFFLADAKTGAFAPLSSPRESPIALSRKSVTARTAGFLAPSVASTTVEEHEQMRAFIARVWKLLHHVDLPELEFRELLSSIESRIPATVYQTITSYLATRPKSSLPSDQAPTTPTKEAFGSPSSKIWPDGSYLISILTDHANTLTDDAERTAYLNNIDPVLSLCKQYSHGQSSRAILYLTDILQRYFDRENYFQKAKSVEDVILAFREIHKEDLSKVVDLCRSHRFLLRRSQLIISIFDEIDDQLHRASGPQRSALKEFAPVVNQFAQLHSSVYADVVLRAKELLLRFELPSFHQRKEAIQRKLVSYQESGDPSVLESIMQGTNSVMDVLADLYLSPLQHVRTAVATVYIRRAYHNFEIKDLTVHEPSSDGSLVIDWYFAKKQTLPIQFNTHKTGGSSSSSVPSRSFDALSAYAPATKKRYRYGLLVSFKNFKNFTEGFESTVLSNFKHDVSSDMRRTASSASLSSLSSLSTPSTPPTSSRGKSVSSLATGGTSPSNSSSLKSRGPRPVHTIKVVLPVPADFNEDAWVLTAAAFLHSRAADLRSRLIRRVTFIICAPNGHYPLYYTFREDLNYGEADVHRHIDPPLAHVLELKRLSNYSFETVTSDDPSVHIYHGHWNGEGSAAAARSPGSTARIFVRSAPIREELLSVGPAALDFSFADAERALVKCLDALALVMASNKKYAGTMGNHIFLNFETAIVGLDYREVMRTVGTLVKRHGPALTSLGVTGCELKLQMKNSSHSDASTIRMDIAAPSRHVLDIVIYKEVLDASTGGTVYSRIYGEGELSGASIDTPYTGLDFLHPLRTKCMKLGTSYVYDFPKLFERETSKAWKVFCDARNLDVSQAVPDPVFIAQELSLSANRATIEPVERPAGSNKCGMIVWRFTLFTPEYPQGRDIMVIANDITFQSGSFGPDEDTTFLLASKLARSEGIPFIYLAANSGARIGLAKEVQSVFQVCWNDPSNPDKGIKYLYLSREDYEGIESSVEGHWTNVWVEPKSFTESEKEKSGWEFQERFVLGDVIGRQHGLNIENLMGSGIIAGEMSAACSEIFTLSYVSARSVGIGAYLVRLGQRVIQSSSSQAPILLTGASALNKVLGREVYSSNLQLGGTQIMHPNGVSHVVVNNDLEGVASILRWLSYVPRTNGSPVAGVFPSDEIDRPVDYIPGMTPDVRHMLEGTYENPLQPQTKWLSGFFDRGSFMPTLEGWAKTVVVGRARLGGIPMGVIAVETKSVDTLIPADPANPESREEIQSQAGQVWYPNTAYKTSQAIRDFNYGEGLPLFVFANWRGFSGGMRDMYEEVLKFGAYIVDELRVYKHPVFMYIPPGAEVRGGAWVVIDSGINPQIEMYADPAGRGGVLEPEGTVEIKYREAELRKTIRRVDHKARAMVAEIAKIEAQLADSSTGGKGGKEGKIDVNLVAETAIALNMAKAKVEAELRERERILLPTYQQVAIQFADLHDTAGRMKTKGAIRDIVEWKGSREYFYWRVRRRLAETQVCNEIMETGGSSKIRDIEHANSILMDWFIGSGNTTDDWESDSRFLDWMAANDSTIRENLRQLSIDNVRTTIVELMKKDPAGVAKLLEELSAKQQI